MNTTAVPDLRPQNAACPMHAGAPRTGLAVGDALRLPLHQRVVTQYATLEDGSRELRLYHGDKEISFDEADLFAFGETLARQSRFCAGSATTWGPGYPWVRVQALLEQLIAEGVLQRADEDTGTEVDAVTPGARPSPLPPAPCSAPRTWFECESITAELAGCAVEPGHLELIVPIFRVAHMALDADGRQVGEANVFPPQLRLDVPTRWRTCIYPGTRYGSALPMNVTALKAMRAHWAPMMRALSEVRAAYLRRFPQARAGWTVGHLERLATTVLAVPTLALMRGTAASGGLHPVLSSLFRVTDGLRMTMHQMLFVPIGEPTLSPDASMTAAEILAYAERNHSFHSERGVCAGPKAMIEEFLAVIVDGADADAASGIELPAAVRAALDDVEIALDYALLGLQAYAAVFSLWPAMTRTYERLSAIADDWAAADAAMPVAALSQRLRGHVAAVKGSTFLANEAWRVDREQVYADMYAQCAGGLHAPFDPLPVLLAPVRRTDHAATERRLVEAIGRQLGRLDGVHGRAWIACLMDFLIQEQAVLGVASAVQARINRLLGRAAPARPFGSTEIDVHNRLQGSATRRLPYLLDELQALFGIRIVIDPQHIAISFPDIDDRHGAAHSPHSSGMVPFEPRAFGTPTTRRSS